MQINITINDRIIDFFKRSKVAIATVSLLLIGAAALYASTLQWTDLQPGDVISASELNSRFNGLRDGLNAMGGADADGTYEWEKINGTLKKVYTEHFIGTTPSNTDLHLAHGKDTSKILSVVASIEHNNTTRIYDYSSSQAATTQFYLIYNGTYIILGDTGSLNRGKPYKITMRWYKD